MKASAGRLRQPIGEHGELLILPDGRILAHNITPPLAAVLSSLNPGDEAMSRRAERKNGLKHELPN